VFFSKTFFRFVLQWLQKNRGSHRLEIFFAYVENVPFCTEPQYESVKTFDFEKKIHKIDFSALKSSFFRILCVIFIILIFFIFKQVQRKARIIWKIMPYTFDLLRLEKRNHCKTKTICVSLRARCTAICQDFAMKQIFSYTFWVAKTCCKRRIIYR